MSDGVMTPYAELADIIDRLPLLIREARRSRGLSLRAAAQESGIHFVTLGRIENGKSMHSDNLAAALRWLDRRETP